MKLIKPPSQTEAAIGKRVLAKICVITGALLAGCLPCEAAKLKGPIPTRLPLLKAHDGYHLTIPSLPFLVLPDFPDVAIVEVGSSPRGEIAAEGFAIVKDKEGHECDSWRAGDPGSTAILEMPFRFRLVVETASLDFHVPGPGTYTVMICLKGKNRKGEPILLESDLTEITAFEDKQPNPNLNNETQHKIK